MVFVGELLITISTDHFAKIWVQQHDKLAAYSWLILRNNDLVDEVLQEVGAIAVAKLDTFESEDHLRNWLRKTCRNVSLQVINRERRQPLPLSSEMFDLIEASWRRFDTASSHWLTDALKACIDELSDYRRQLVELRYQEGLPSGQIAKRLGRSANTIYTGLARTRSQLAACIQAKIDQGET